VLRAVAATLDSYCKALVFSVRHDGHDQYFSVHPGRTRVICECGEDRWI
jgi:hypothetical protein